MKLNDERRWYLRRYERGGWNRDALTAAKWDRHRDMLVKGGLLEQIGEGRAAMYRITEAGVAALIPTP
jgi:hypothetical protein